MNRRDMLKLGLGLIPPATVVVTGCQQTVTNPIRLAPKSSWSPDPAIMDKATWDRLVTRRPEYPPEFYISGNAKDKSPGIHRLKIDNRTLEITLPDKPPPDDFSMPQALHTTGATLESILTYLANNLHGISHQLFCFSGYWSHEGFFSETARSWVDAFITFKPNPIGFIRDKSRDIPGSVVPGSRIVKVDYFKLDDFILSLKGLSLKDSYMPVMNINGRRWVRSIYWSRAEVGMGLLPNYEETFFTPLDQHRLLTVRTSLNYQRDYKIPDEMPDWMRKLTDQMTNLLRSIKLSPPDDGSEDPFLLDPEQKPSLPLIEFPASPSSG